MTRDHRDCVAGVIYCLLGLGWGIVLGIGLGLRIDLDRDAAMPAMIEYFDMRSSSYDVVSDTTFISPRQPRPDPAEGE